MSPLQIFFGKSEERMKHHISLCSAQEGITYSFDNAQIINYQDNYKYMGDVPFTIYFDFETTTGNAVFFDSKMFVVSYCMIVSFNRRLKFPKIVIYRSFDETADEIFSLSHFSNEHEPFTASQLRDAARAVVSRKKCTSLAEMFNVELKFIINTLKCWFEKNN